MNKKNKSLLFVLFILITIAAMGQDVEAYWIDKYYSVSYPLSSIKTTSPFGTRKSPFTGKSQIHSGIDLRARYEEALAMFDGYVKNIGQNSRSGIFIIMQFGEYTISYCHLSKVLVRPNERLYAGDIVGITGNSGSSTAPHLHITARLNGKLVNPNTLLEFISETKRRALTALRLEESKILPPDDFIKKYAPIAMNQQRKYGIPSSVILAQMCTESGFGTSTLSRSGYNFFGIKASPLWIAKGLPFSYHKDDKENEKFCTYASPEESIMHHTQLLLSDRYRECFRYGPTDYHNWLVAIKRAGYATAHNYVANCESVIRKYHLYKYDIEAMRM